MLTNLRIEVTSSGEITLSWKFLNIYYYLFLLPTYIFISFGFNEYLHNGYYLTSPYPYKTSLRESITNLREVFNV